MNRRFRDKPQQDAAGYCDQWGYRPQSAVGQLIDHLRAEHRVKYGCNYRLERMGKNHFRVLAGCGTCPGHCSPEAIAAATNTFWRDTVLKHAAEFKVHLE